MSRSLVLACLLLAPADAFMIQVGTHGASQNVIQSSSHLSVDVPRVNIASVRMDAAADAKAAKVEAAKEKAAKAKAAKAEVADEPVAKEETPEEIAAREEAEKKAAEEAAKKKAEEEAAAKKAEEEAKRAEEEAARVAAVKAAAIDKAKMAVERAGADFGIAKGRYVKRWTVEAVKEGDSNLAALTELNKDLFDNVGVVVSLVEGGDARCVAMVGALDELQKALTGELITPASQILPTVITVKSKGGLSGQRPLEVKSTISTNNGCWPYS